MSAIYLFGPMRGYPDFNFQAFADGTAKLRALGHEVFSPAERDLNLGFDPAGNGSDEDLAAKSFDLRDALGADLAWITARAEMLVGLPGWQRSAGSLAEVHTAWALRLPVYALGCFLAGDLSAPIRPRLFDLEAA